MLESLMEKYPGRFDFPSESEIRSEITRLMQQAKKGNNTQGCLEDRTTCNNTASAVTHTTRSVLTLEQCQFITSTITLYPKITPKSILKSFRNQYGNDTPATDTQILTKVNNVKSSNKRAKTSELRALESIL